MYKIGVVGAGHLGRIHIKILQNADFVNLVGFYDIDRQVREKINVEFGVKAFESYSALIDECDIIDIVTPTLSHYNCAKQALHSFKHIFIEKPVTHTLDEVRKLIKLSNKYGLKAQVGHVERFNPAFIEAKKRIKNPRFIEVHRLAQFNSRGTDVSVVLDLMIHDFILEHNVSIILGRIHSLPNFPEDDIDQPFKTPKILADAGILFCLDYSGDMPRMGARNLPFLAGTAAAFGLDKEEALKLITYNTAKILGIDNTTGTLETGKDANLFVSNGDALDMITNDVEIIFLMGKVLKVENHQTKLYEKFSDKLNLKK